MKELEKILERYEKIDLKMHANSLASLKKYSADFYSDVANIYGVLTRVRNVERNPNGFSLDEAPILGLLVRIWKILKEVTYYYDKNNADIISLLDRQLVEAAIYAKYLLSNDQSVIEDYRKCSYKSRLEILTESENRTDDFFHHPPGKRLLKSIKSKLEYESLTTQSFELQKKNRWKLQGKSFYKIFESVEDKGFYKFLYGIPSEGVHGSWNHSIDFDLVKNNDGTFSANPFYQDVDIRFVTPLLRLSNDAFQLWVKKIEINNESIDDILTWIHKFNATLYLLFEKHYTLENR